MEFVEEFMLFSTWQGKIFKHTTEDIKRHEWLAWERERLTI